MSAKDEEGGNGEATWICRDERLGKHPTGRKAPWIDLNWLHKNRSGKHRGDWERDGLPRRRGNDGGLLEEGWRTGTCGGGDGGGGGALPRWPSAQRLLTPARGSCGGGSVGVFFFFGREPVRGEWWELRCRVMRGGRSPNCGRAPAHWPNISRHWREVSGCQCGSRPNT